MSLLTAVLLAIVALAAVTCQAQSSIPQFVVTIQPTLDLSGALQNGSLTVPSTAQSVLFVFESGNYGGCYPSFDFVTALPQVTEFTFASCPQPDSGCGTVTLQCTIEGPSVTSSSGTDVGAPFFVSLDPAVSLTVSFYNFNFVGLSGAAFAPTLIQASNSTVTFSFCTISSNQGKGGVIVLNEDSLLVLNQVSLADNQVEGSLITLYGSAVQGMNIQFYDNANPAAISGAALLYGIDCDIFLSEVIVDGSSAMSPLTSLFTIYNGEIFLTSAQMSGGTSAAAIGVAFEMYSSIATFVDVDMGNFPVVENTAVVYGDYATDITFNNLVFSSNNGSGSGVTGNNVYFNNTSLISNNLQAVLVKGADVVAVECLFGLNTVYAVIQANEVIAIEVKFFNNVILLSPASSGAIIELMDGATAVFDGNSFNLASLTQAPVFSCEVPRKVSISDNHVFSYFLPWCTLTCQVAHDTSGVCGLATRPLVGLWVCLGFLGVFVLYFGVGALYLRLTTQANGWDLLLHRVYFRAAWTLLVQKCSRKGTASHYDEL